MNDLHAHILPGADHGSADVETSRRQLRFLASCGITSVVATPHFYADSEDVTAFFQRRYDASVQLMKVWEPGMPRLYVGAEVLATDGIDHMVGIERFCIAGTKLLLLEMPFFAWKRELKHTVRRMCRGGFQVLLAHVNRYPAQDVEELFGYGALGQLNTEAFRAFGSMKPHFREWIATGKIVALGSDLHGPGTVAAARRIKRADMFHASGVEYMNAFTDELLAHATELSDTLTMNG